MSTTTSIVVPDLAARVWASTLSRAVGTLHRNHRELSNHLASYAAAMSAGSRPMTHAQRFTDVMEAEAEVVSLLTLGSVFIRTDGISEDDVRRILAAGEDYVSIDGEA